MLYLWLIRVREARTKAQVIRVLPLWPIKMENWPCVVALLPCGPRALNLAMHNYELVKQFVHQSHFHKSVLCTPYLHTEAAVSERHVLYGGKHILEGTRLFLTEPVHYSTIDIKLLV